MCLKSHRLWGEHWGLRRKDKMIWGILNFLDDDNDVRVDVRCFDTSDHGQVTKTDAALG
jgi:hypothetical protein